MTEEVQECVATEVAVHPKQEDIYDVSDYNNILKHNVNEYNPTGYISYKEPLFLPRSGSTSFELHNELTNPPSCSIVNEILGQPWSSKRFTDNYTKRCPNWSAEECIRLIRLYKQQVSLLKVTNICSIILTVLRWKSPPLYPGRVSVSH
jgi:hypothetical protein